MIATSPSRTLYSEVLQSSALPASLAPLALDLSILAREHAQHPSRKIPVVAIAGCSGVGKTTIARLLQESLQREGVVCVIVHFDDWTNPEDAREKNYFNLEGVHEFFASFLEGKQYIEKPVVHELTGEHSREILDLRGVDLILFEGLFALSANEPSDYFRYCDKGIFVEASEQDIWKWKRERPTHVHRTHEEFAQHMQAIFDYHRENIEPFKKNASWIVSKDGSHGYSLTSSYSPQFFSQEVVVPTNVLKVVRQYFQNTSDHDIKITPLLGGNSSANFCVEVAAKRYVLRFNEKASPLRFQSELFAMQEAAQAGISPTVFQSFLDDKMVLMEYVDASTLTIEQANQVENCAKVATALRTAHAITKNPYHGSPRNEVMEGFYSQLLTYPEIQNEITQAIQFIRKGHHELLNMPSSYSVNTHNDLNPGNIFLSGEKVLLIDWEGTNWEDPFYDLSYFAIFHNYDENMELVLLKNYLGRDPSSEELMRYNLTKRINFSRMSLSCYYIAFIQNKDTVNRSELKDWRYYIRAFNSKSYDNLRPTQFFYNLARAALREAIALN